MRYIDTKTGEIMSATTEQRTGRAASARKAIGSETKWPVECVTADSLLTALQNIDANLHYKADLDYAYLTESLTEKLLTVNEVATLRLLGEQLTAWNYWFGSVGKLEARIPGGHVARMLKALEDKNAIEILHRDRPFRRDLVIKVNPVIAFKGSWVYRDRAIQSWYSAQRLLARS